MYVNFIDTIGLPATDSNVTLNGSSLFRKRTKQSKRNSQIIVPALHNFEVDLEERVVRRRTAPCRSFDRVTRIRSFWLQRFNNDGAKHRNEKHV